MQDEIGSCLLCGEVAELLHLLGPAPVKRSGGRMCEKSRQKWGGAWHCKMSSERQSILHESEDGDWSETGVASRPGLGETSCLAWTCSAAHGG